MNMLQLETNSPAEENFALAIGRITFRPTRLRKLCTFSCSPEQEQRTNGHAEFDEVSTKKGQLQKHDSLQRNATPEVTSEPPLYFDCAQRRFFHESWKIFTCMIYKWNAVDKMNVLGRSTSAAADI